MFVLSTHGLGFNFEYFKSFVTKGLLRDYFTWEPEVLIEHFM